MGQSRWFDVIVIGGIAGSVPFAVCIYSMYSAIRQEPATAGRVVVSWPNAQPRTLLPICLAVFVSVSGAVASAQKLPEAAGQGSSQVVTPCPAPELDVASWIWIEQDRFTFRLPPGFHEVKLDGAVDSWVRQFESADSTVFVSFDWGWYSDPLQGPAVESYPHLGACEERIGGRRARIITLWPLGAGSYGSSERDTRYGAGAAWRDITPGVHLTLFGWADDPQGLAQLLRTFRTVRFGADTDGVGTGSGDSAAAFPQQVNVSQGIIYLAGHRFAAPLTIGYCGQEFCVNGFTVSQDIAPRYPVPTRSAVDSSRYELSHRADEIARDGKRRDVPFDLTLQRILDLYRASPLVASADLHGNELTVYFVGSRIRYMRDFPRDVALEDPPPGYVERRAARIRYDELQELQKDLSTGHLIVHSGRAYTILPAATSLELDAIIQKVLSGASLGSEERRVLESNLPEFVGKDLSAPKPLRAARSSR